MPKIKKKLTPAQKRAKAERRKMYQIVFINGKQVRVKRPPMVEGVPVDEFIANNADPIWLHQHGMWELIPYEDSDINRERPEGSERDDRELDLPF